MKKLWLVMLFTVSLVLSGIVARAQDATEEPATKTLLGDFLKEHNVDVTVSGTADFYNKYIWRGFLLDDDPVFQPSFTVAAAGFAVSGWGNFDLDNEDALASDEIDTTVSYTFHPIEKLNMSVGHIYYAFLDPSTFAKEVYASIGVNTLLTPTVSYYWDYSREAQGGGDGYYVAFDVSQAIPVIPKYNINLNLGAHAGYNHKDFVAGVGGDLLGTAGLSIPVTANLTMTPKVSYAVPLGDLEDDAFAAQREQIYGGVSMAYTF